MGTDPRPATTHPLFAPGRPPPAPAPAPLGEHDQRPPISQRVASILVPLADVHNSDPVLAEEKRLLREFLYTQCFLNEMAPTRALVDRLLDALRGSRDRQAAFGAYESLVAACGPHWQRGRPVRWSMVSELPNADNWNALVGAVAALTATSAGAIAPCERRPLLPAEEARERAVLLMRFYVAALHHDLAARPVPGTVKGALKELFFPHAAAALALPDAEPRWPRAEEAAQLAADAVGLLCGAVQQAGQENDLRALLSELFTSLPSAPPAPASSPCRPAPAPPAPPRADAAQALRPAELRFSIAAFLVSNNYELPPAGRATASRRGGRRGRTGGGAGRSWRGCWRRSRGGPPRARATKRRRRRGGGARGGVDDEEYLALLKAAAASAFAELDGPSAPPELRERLAATAREHARPPGPGRPVDIEAELTALQLLAMPQAPAPGAGALVDLTAYSS
eukprot:tig00000489_g1369.t1